MHAEVVDAVANVKPWRAGAARHRLRAAKVAESDLLRALGFADWSAFLDYLGDSEEPSVVAEDEFAAVDLDLVVEHAADEAAGVGEIATGEVEHLAALLAGTRAQVIALHGSVAELSSQLERVLLETVALRLELMVAQRRRPAGGLDDEDRTSR